MSISLYNYVYLSYNSLLYVFMEIYNLIIMEWLLEILATLFLSLLSHEKKRKYSERFCAMKT